MIMNIAGNHEVLENTFWFNFTKVLINSLHLGQAYVDWGGDCNWLCSWAYLDLI